jgi:hypothetical protein
MTTLDCAIIVSEKRADLVRRDILPSVLRQGLFREVLVVGDFQPGDGYRYLAVPRVTGTTMDALMKRECAAVASRADALLYICDDHLLLDGWASEWPAYEQGHWGVLVPARYTVFEDGAMEEINNGMDTRWPGAPYCGGHAGIFRREVLRARPWMASPHDLFWDLGHSRQVRDSGFPVVHCPDLKVLDVDPNPAEKARHGPRGLPIGEPAVPAVD